MPDNAFASIYVPTLRERFWRRMGFQLHMGDDPEGTELLSGWSRTTIGFKFSIADRLRLLLTGRLRVDVSSHFDTPSPSVVINRTDFRILAPGDK